MRRKWLGGYVRRGTFIIERWVGGQHFHISTRCRLERAALEQLARFEADPESYRPGGDGEAVVMNADLVDEHERWQLAVKRNTAKHVANCGTYLEGWMMAFDGTDLRHVTVADLKRELGQWPTAQRYRTIAIKGFFRWLRQEKGLLKHSEDASLDLAVPRVSPAKLRRKRALERTHVERAYAQLRPGPARDVVRLQAATGLHFSEVVRFASEGELFPPTPEQRKGGVLANLAVKHKTGALHVVALVDRDVFEAAGRLKGQALPSIAAVNWAVEAACRAAKVPTWTIGVLRHSVATWLAFAGTPLAQIAELLGHRSPTTTANFYRDMGHTAASVHVPKLRLVKSG